MALTASQRAADEVAVTTPLLGLTGGLGAGKTTALAMLAELGAATISSDAIVHELYERAAVRDKLARRWGPAVLTAHAVDRAAVAQRAFADPREREWLEALLWPLVAARRDELVDTARARRPAPRAIVVEVPLLFEAGIESDFDATIALVATDSTRRERAAQRGHANLDEREARQLPQADKALRATYVVANDATPDDLRHALADLLDGISA